MRILNPNTRTNHQGVTRRANKIRACTTRVPPKCNPDSIAVPATERFRSASQRSEHIGPEPINRHPRIRESDSG